MAYSADTFVADEIPTTAKWNKLWNNDASFNDGTGIGSGVITAAKLATTAVNATNTDWSTTGNVWWQEMGRATLSGTTTSLSFTAKKYLKVLLRLVPTAPTSTARIRFNGDTGSNYAGRYSTNSVDSTELSLAYISPFGTSAAEISFGDFSIYNEATAVKILTGSYVTGNTTSAGSAPTTRVISAKWINTASQINSITVYGDSSGVISGECIVLGHD